MAIKKLQNDYTTPEQSKRLLEIGVPADSADMLWDGTYDLVNGWEFEDYPTFSDKHYSYYQGLYREEDAVNILPCWSVGRLIEIYHICDKPGFSFSFHVCFPNLVSEVIYKIVEAKEHGWINFSKLEE